MLLHTNHRNTSTITLYTTPYRVRRILQHSGCYLSVEFKVQIINRSRSMVLVNGLTRCIEITLIQAAIPSTQIVSKEMHRSTCYAGRRQKEHSPQDMMAIRPS